MDNKKFYTVRGYQMLNDNKLTSSMEDYLEMIYRTTLAADYIRVNQLAGKLNVQPSSATKVVQKLKRLGMIDYEKYGIIKLTEEGKEIGQFLYNRHEILESFLQKIGVKETLLKDTEMIEHDMSLSALENINILNEFFKEYPDILDKYYVFKINYKKDSF